MTDAQQHPMPYETQVEVRSYELDSFAHANHAVLLNYLEHARYEALGAAGFSYASLQERGWGVYVVRVEVDYLAEARLGDRLRIRTGAEAPKRASIVLVQEVARADAPDEIVARGRITAVWVGPDRRPMRVPPEVRAAFGCDAS